MDIINHGAWSYFLMEKIEADPYLITAAVVMGIAPDLLGMIGGSINNKWGLYNKAHKFKWWMALLPFYSLHLLMDYPAHIENKKYWWHSDIISWIILMITFWILL